jgi:hypothetical protein
VTADFDQLGKYAARLREGLQKLGAEIAARRPGSRSLALTLADFDAVRVPSRRSAVEANATLI